ncbi:MAG: hypothetical protein J2P23_08460 [Microlunatus sp.]|nr:hypothetical protein [Microlunatus sp.]
MNDELEPTLSAALEQLADQAPTGPVEAAPIIRRETRRRRRLIAVPVALAVLVAAVVTGVTVFRPRQQVMISPAARSACTPLETGTPPTWARGGFHGGYVPFARSRSGNVVAFVFGTLSAPPAADQSNKVLWVVRGGSAAEIDITAHLEGSGRVRTLQVPAGPSYVNMPAPGCWQLDLRIGNRYDTIDLRWTRP